MSKNILLADGDVYHREILQNALAGCGFCCESIESARGALVKINNKHIDLAILDLSLPDMDGIELFKILIQVSPKTSVIIITSIATINSSIEALRLGAIDYMTKPINMAELQVKIKRLFELKDFMEKAQFLHQQINQQYNFSNIVAKSDAMKNVCNLIKRVAKTDSNVLITGRSGTGKELVARAIHCNSKRRNHQFITVNCGAISEGLFESELFGHKKGAFTNAIKDKDGLFKIASKGTLFFDEISSLSAASQVKLLRAIEFNKIVPVGATEPFDVDIRYIASTNRELVEAIEHHGFREDLFYRLNVFEIRVPSLAERKEDTQPLVQQFINKFAREMNKPVQGIEHSALEVLKNACWKGEVRELENAIERAMIFCEKDLISTKDLPNYLLGQSNDKFELNYNKPLREAVKEFEKHFILKNLRIRGGHRLRAFKAMGMSESSFYRKIEELDLKDYMPSKACRVKKKQKSNH